MLSYSYSTMQKSVSLPLQLLVTSLLFLMVGVLTIEKSFAQTTLEPGAGASIALEPDFPEPMSTVEASLDAYTLNTTGATITWYLDAVALPQFQNARSIAFQSGAVGTKQIVSAAVKPVGSPAFTLKKEIAPIAVDIIVEASTYIPSFYRGRALPSADAPVRVVAIPHTGGGTSPSNLTYRWEQNGSVLFGGPVRGKQTASLTVPRYYGGYISVTVLDGEKAVAQRNVTFDAKSPELHFYEENPLRGLSERALTESFTLIGEETTVHGEPYFMNTTRTAVTYDWSIDGANIQNSNSDPHIITLRKTGGAGTARVGLEAVSDNGIPEFVTGNFVINF
jgi:hypothetical protein